MKKLLTIVLLINLFLLNNCKPIASSSSFGGTPVAATSFPTFTPLPIPTVTSTSSPFLHINTTSLVHVNAMTPISMPDETISIWTVGDNGFINYRSQDGSSVSMTSPVREDLYDVAFVSANDGWIVGENSLILHWNGVEWKVSKPPSDSRWPYSYDFYSVAFNEANDGWAAGCTGSEGGNYFLVYHWNGSVWSEISLSGERNLWACVDDIVALSPTDVWMVGAGQNEGKEYGITIHWDGKEWKLFSDLHAYDIDSLSALASDNVWAITRNGIVLNWNGVEWKENVQLNSANMIFAQNPDDIFAVGADIWYWDGNTWANISSSSNFPGTADIKSMIAPYKAESGYFDLWMLDSSGIIYRFPHPRTKRS